MHRYLRAIGFSGIKKREELRALIDEVVKTNLSKSDNQIGDYVSSRDVAVDDADRAYAELSLDFVHSAGICIRGEFDEENRFLYEYYFPYLLASQVSSYVDVTVERHAE